MEKLVLSNVDLFILLKQKEEENPKFKEQFNCVSLVENIYKEAYNYFRQIEFTFSTYTNHTEQHSFNIMRYMYKLAAFPEDLSYGTIFFMIASALCHDLGMALTNDDKERIMKNQFVENQKNIMDYNKVLKYCNEKYGVNKAEIEAIKRIARNFHHETVEVKINEICNKIGIEPDDPRRIVPILFNVCRAHRREYKFILDAPSSATATSIEEIDNKLNIKYSMASLRLADTLDARHDRASSKQNQTTSESEEHNTAMTSIFKNFVNPVCEEEKCVENKHIMCKKYQKKISIGITIPKGHNAKNVTKRLLEIIDEIESEIKIAKKITEQEKDYTYRFNLSEHVDCQTTSKSSLLESPYIKVKTETKNFINLFLGEKLYKDKQIVVRELLQNAIDACKYKIAKLDSEHFDNIYKNKSKENMEIRITYDKENSKFSMHDSGIGMTEDILKNYFLNIGGSIYKSDAFNFSNQSFLHSGNHGIGFFSSFMLAKKIRVETSFFASNPNNKDIYIFTIEKNNDYGDFEKQINTSCFSGTKITLDCESFFDIFPDKTELVLYIKKFFITDASFSADITSKIKLITPSGEEDIPLYSFDHIVEQKQKKFLKDKGVKCVDLTKYLDGIKAIVFVNEFDIHEIFISEKFIRKNKNEFKDNQEVLVFDILLDDKKSIVRLCMDLAHKKMEDKFGYCDNNSMSFDDTNKYYTDVNELLERESINKKTASGQLTASVAKAVYFNGNIKFNDSIPSLAVSDLCAVKNTTNLYVRNILVPDTTISLLNVGGCQLVFSVLHITNDKIIPTIDRNNLETNILQEINLAISLAILKYKADNYGIRNVPELMNFENNRFVK